MHAFLKAKDALPKTEVNKVRLRAVLLCLCLQLLNYEKIKMRLFNAS